MKPGGIGSLESILGLLKSLKNRAMYSHQLKCNQIKKLILWVLSLATSVALDFTLPKVMQSFSISLKQIQVKAMINFTMTLPLLPPMTRSWVPCPTTRWLNPDPPYTYRALNINPPRSGTSAILCTVYTWNHVWIEKKVDIVTFDVSVWQEHFLGLQW